MRDGEMIEGKRKEKRMGNEGIDKERKRDHTTQYIKALGGGGGQDRSLLL